MVTAFDFEYGVNMLCFRMEKQYVSKVRQLLKTISNMIQSSKVSPLPNDGK